MKVWLAAAVVVLGGLHQDPVQPRPATGVVSGRVVHGVTGAPIPGATVSFFAHDRPDRMVDPRVSLVTANNGTFAFTAVPAGQIDVTASAIGFLEGAYGRLRPEGPGLRIPLKDAERASDLTIRLWPAASIAGRVTNERGEPMPGVHVNVYRVSEVEGARLEYAAGSARTDTTGDYTIAGLRPGRYVASVPVHRLIYEVRPPSGDSSCAPPPPPRPEGLPPAPPVPPPPPSPPVGTLIVNLPRGIPRLLPTTEGPPKTYRTTFVPGGDSPDLNAAFDIAVGQTRFGFDVVLRPVAGFRVEGRLIDPTGSLQGEVTLSIAETAMSLSQPDVTTFLKPDGSFVFLEVPAGRYRVKAQRFSHVTCDTRAISEPAWFGGIVEIGSSPADNITLTQPARTTVQGRVQYRGAAPRPRVVSGGLVLEAGAAERGGGRMDVTGEQIVSRVVPGRYSAYFIDSSTQMPGSHRWWIESITLEGVSILDQSVEIGARDLDSLVVTMTDTASVLEGPVLAADPAAVVGTTVVVFPARADRTMPFVPQFSTSSRVIDGRYRFEHLPPGEYLLAVVEEAQMEGWWASAFEDRRSRSTRIVMTAGQSKVVTLQMRQR